MSDDKMVKPTPSELEILQILWQKGKATVREVHESLAEFKDSGYTTTLKLMQIMYEKGLVSRDESSRTHIYSPAVSKEKVQQSLLDRLIHTLFGGSPGELVLQVLGHQKNKTTPEELEKIQQLLDSIKK
ncbi:MAG: BlaI/MecI/CopY family transcriptional regulator [Chitinophagaceae bacterium]|nr:BlaI/MecI/CopY family transcriptional regulator [Chitinophagaceae bacterium]